MAEIETLKFYSGKQSFTSGDVFKYPSAAASYMMSVRPADIYYSALINMLPQETKPSVKDVLTQVASKSFKSLLIPQHLSKFHPIFDIALSRILQEVPNSKIIILQPKNKLQWKLTLEKRWRKSLGDHVVKNRIIWAPSLNPNEYLTLLALGDVMLDPFPFGGGVTNLEALSVCTAVVTSPDLQTVPGLAAGMLREIFSSNEKQQNLAIVKGVQAYVDSVKQLLSSSSGDKEYDLITQMRIHICKSSHLVFNQTKSVESWSTLLHNLI